MESLFSCPICGGTLNITDSAYSCAAGHVFDRAAKGYVNLLPPNRKNSKEPGDDVDSIRARQRFLNGGFYAPLAERLRTLATKFLPQNGTLLDCCCGEGYYTRALRQALCTYGKNPRCAAFDISRTGIRYAATRSDPTEYAVAGVFHIPAPDAQFDLTLLCFAPYCDAEMTRILKPNGILLRVLPGKRHLFALKAQLYEHPYENDETGDPVSTLQCIDTQRVQAKIHVDRTQLTDLLAMTPYAYRTAPAAIARLQQLPGLETEIEFIIECFRKP